MLLHNSNYFASLLCHVTKGQSMADIYRLYCLDLI